MIITSRLLSLEYDELVEYGVQKNHIITFIKPHNADDNPREKAIDLVRNITTNHGKQQLVGYIENLNTIEQSIRLLEPQQRDHVVHTVLTYFLGIYINERFLRPKGFQVKEFEWKIACLMHDVGYPVENAIHVAKKFTDNMNKMKTEIVKSNNEVYCSVIPRGLDELCNEKNSFDLLTGRFEEWGLDINSRTEYKKMIKEGLIYHGMISALAVLHIIDLMYQKNNPSRAFKDPQSNRITSWNQKYFEQDVVSACAAIFSHNLPDRCFRREKIDPQKAPLAFLLKLSDELQDWGRPSHEDTKGNPANDYDIKVEDGYNYCFMLKML